MLEPDQWDSVLANVKGTVVHGSQRVSSNRYLRLTHRLVVVPGRLSRSNQGWIQRYYKI